MEQYNTFSGQQGSIECDISDFLRIQRSIPSTNRTSANKSKLTFLKSLIDKYEPTSILALERQLTTEEYEDLYGLYQANWQSSAKQIIRNKTASRIAEIQQNGMNNWFFGLEEKEPNEATTKWLDEFWEANKIKPEEFLTWFFAIGNKTIPKVNTLTIQGPSNCGKSMITNLILESYPSARLGRQGELTPFYLQSAATKPIIIFEEPRIIETTVDDMKLLLGGEPMEIAVKNNENEHLQRTPVYITTNRTPAADCGYTNIQAIKNRMMTFYFHKRIGVDIPRCPTMLTQSNLVHYFKQHKDFIAERCDNLPYLVEYYDANQ